MDDPLDPPPVWTIRLADRGRLRGTLGGILKDLHAHGFEVLALEAVPTGIVSLVGVHPFRGRALFAGTYDGSVAGWSAHVRPYRSRAMTMTATAARKWVKATDTPGVDTQ